MHTGIAIAVISIYVVQYYWSFDSISRHVFMFLMDGYRIVFDASFGVRSSWTLKKFPLSRIVICDVMRTGKVLMFNFLGKYAFFDEKSKSLNLLR